MPHSHLLAGADDNRASPRTPKSRVAAGFLFFDTVATADFDGAGRASTKVLPDNPPHVKIAATEDPTRTVHLWQIMFRESIVETAKRLRSAPCVEDVAAKMKIRLGSSAVGAQKPRNVKSHLQISARRIDVEAVNVVCSGASYWLAAVRGRQQERSRPPGKLRTDPEGNLGHSRRHSPGPPGQIRMCNRVPVRSESRFCFRRQLWTWRYDLPHRLAFHGPMERPYDH